MKKGFTLVELLAVIAILSILVIIAIPNVIGLYNKSKRKLFVTEVKTVYKKIEENYITNRINDKLVLRISSEDETKLDMSGKKLKYCFILNSSGKVLYMNASDGKYNIELKGKQTFEDLQEENVRDGNLDDFDCKSVPATLE